MDNQYWTRPEELQENYNISDLELAEFPQGLSEEPYTETSRRNFLKIAGFTISSTALAAACSKAPVDKAIPYVNKPEEITPGVANWYASTCHSCSASCPILVKTREARPIKIEGNDLEENFAKGGVCAVGQASVLELYDSERLQYPLINKSKSTWKEVDKQIKSELDKIKSGKIRILSSTITSPSTKKLINEFIKKYPNTKLVTYDSISYSALRQIHQELFRINGLPDYRFEKADLIISFNADFLGTWLSPVEFTKKYVSNRNTFQLETKKDMSRHIQFESIMTLTGSNADYRHPIKPSEEKAILITLLNYIANDIGETKLNSLKIDAEIDKPLRSYVQELLAKKGRSIVLSGTNDLEVQSIIAKINQLLNNYENTINIKEQSFQKNGNDFELIKLIKELESSSVDALFVLNCNPVYSLPDGKKFAELIKQVSLSVSFSDRIDETSRYTKYQCPNHHFLESWNDSLAKSGHYSLTQPTIHSLFNTRQFQDSLLIWLDSDLSYYDYIKQNVQLTLFNKQSKQKDFTIFWNKILHDGIFKFEHKENYVKASLRLKSIKPEKLNPDSLELVLYESIGLRDGSHNNNPWLLEFPDPISKVTWGNFLVFSPYDAKNMDIEQGNIVEISDGKTKMKLPAFIQPGQKKKTVAIALGYGRQSVGKAGNSIGVNAYPYTKLNDNGFIFVSNNIKINKTSDSEKLAQTQTYYHLHDPILKIKRPIIKETTLKDWKKSPDSGNRDHVELMTLSPNRKFAGDHEWGMYIDLNACTGCGACVVSCQAENNVAVVGKEMVADRREMHWIRIDRYYNGSEDNPEVVYQPMMCQHCDSAPCEPVCPVLATSQTQEGLNGMTYNRCVGTRFCAVNCPYKVRRFNLFNYIDNDKFDYNLNDDYGKLVLNPDVVVRSRGVMEKCSMCIQRIQDGKLKAKKDGTRLIDGTIKTACQQSCPADAIVFGDLKDPNSKIAQLKRNQNNKRLYYVLEELKTVPSVGYLTKVRNKDV